MQSDSITVSAIISASPEKVYEAWLDSAQHSAMTGGVATITAGVGELFTAWHGYISGKNLALEPGRRIIQSWRTDNFPADAPYSQLDIALEPADAGTRVTITHTQIPAGQGVRYQQGWQDRYFTPMQRHFS